MRRPPWHATRRCSSSTSGVQFEKNREAGEFDDYPDPAATIGQALIAGTPRPAGRMLVTHLGLGLSDVVFGSAVLRAATAAGRGLVLPR